jgi:ribosomal protein S18 acetylase RimI-like enzyme
MPPVAALVRVARPEDLAVIARFAGELVRLHHEFDGPRFMLPPNVEAGYERYFRQELASGDAAILTAERAGELLGYAYGRLEPRDWNNLLDEHGAVHDIFVAAAARGQGVGRALLAAMLDELRRRGARSVVLYTATPNREAQCLFQAMGFRSTMIEMTRELE